jgi:uncharacterized membrane protein
MRSDFMRALLFDRSLLPLLIAAAFAVLTTWMTWAEHATFNSTSLDMAVYSQLVWDGGAGRPFETTLLLNNRLHLAEHLALLLLPLTPLYALVADVRLLLGMQQVILGLTAAPVYWLSRRWLGSWPAVTLTACYLLMPTLAEVALDAVYPIVFATLLTGWATALALQGRSRSACLLALLAVLWEEEAALVGAGLALYLLVRGGSRSTATALLAASAVWLVVGELVLMPAYTQGGNVDGDTRAESHFSELRDEPFAWIVRVAIDRLDPDLARSGPLRRTIGPAPACAQQGQCSALRWWLYPTAGLPLLAPQTLLVVAPSAAALLLADRPGRFRRHWVAPLLPGLWLSGVAGLARLRRLGPRAVAPGPALAVVATVIFFRLDSSLPLGGQYEPQDTVANALSADLERLGRRVPGDASLLASRRGLAHFANRAEVYVFPPSDYARPLWPPTELPRWALLDLRNGDTQRALEAQPAEARGYREVERTPNALLLQAAR